MKLKIHRIFLGLAIGLSTQVAHADILGAAAGGLIGSQFGQGNGKIAMAALGAVIGDRLTEQNSSHTPPVTYNNGYAYAEEGAPEPRFNRPYGYVAPNYQAAPVYQAPVRVTVYPNYYPIYSYGYRNFPPGYGHGHRHRGHY